MRALSEKLLASGADEIFVNGSCGASILRGKDHLPLKLPEADRAGMIRELQEFALQLGLRLDPYQPEAGGSLANGRVRWHCLIPPAAPLGPVISLRRHRFHQLSAKDFADPDRQLPQIREAIGKNQPVLFCGETGSGKSSLLHVLMQELLNDARLILIEEEEELPVSSPLWSRLLVKKEERSGQGALTTAALLKSALRLRPDRLIFGELRGHDIRCFPLALISGFEGPLATIHAHSGEDVLQGFKQDPGSGVKKELLLVFCQRGSPPRIRQALWHRL